MEDAFSILAPRCGSKPIFGGNHNIGISDMNGGAISFSTIWTGLKNLGSLAKNIGIKAVNSSIGQKLKNKLKETQIQEKIVDGISTGIHGAIDLVRQELDKNLEKKLLKQSRDNVTTINDEKSKPSITVTKKRPIEEATDKEDDTSFPPPPTYDEAIKQPLNNQFSGFYGNRRDAWQDTLNNIVGLGLQTYKKQKCYY